MIDNKQLERIEKKMDDQNEHLASIDVTLAQQHISIKRIALLEQEIKPIKRHVYMVQGAAALIGLLATIATIWATMK